MYTVLAFGICKNRCAPIKIQHYKFRRLFLPQLPHNTPPRTEPHFSTTDTLISFSSNRVRLVISSVDIRKTFSSTASYEKRREARGGSREREYVDLVVVPILPYHRGSAFFTSPSCQIELSSNCAIFPPRVPSAVSASGAPHGGMDSGRIQSARVQIQSSKHSLFII